MSCFNWNNGQYSINIMSQVFSSYKNAGIHIEWQ